MEPLRIAVVGASGRMGLHLCELTQAAADLCLAAAIDAGGRAGTVALAAADPQTMDVVVDFSAPAAVAEVASWCAAHGKPWVLGTTGLDASGQAAVDAAARQVAVFQATNFSIGVALLADLAARAAAVLGCDADVEIIETHHHHKQDAPSGTALTLAHAVATARGQQLHEVRCDGRSGITGARPRGQIGLHAVRVADIVGEHEVVLGWPAERLRLHHDARDRKVFAHGALRAARWLHGRPAGLYGMRDLLDV